MEKKVLLILVDGMRPDSLEKCGHPYIKELLSKSSYTLSARTVMPSVTLPCHMSLFHSVVPERHGVMTNTYTPQVRPIDGIFEQVNRFGGSTAMYYDWAELRDLARPGSVLFSYMFSGHNDGWYQESLKQVNRAVLQHLPDKKPDFAFYYIGLTDEIGHKYGWMGEEFLKAVHDAWDSIERVIAAAPSEYQILITADHGGHERMHGTELPEDMTTPLICYGSAFEAGKQLQNASILDIAPTVAKLLGIPAVGDWEGHALV
jgi:predicted AlkP superfamily pyrophosphatase or phosphodiesterase